MPSSLTRRDLLRRSGAVALTVGLASAAGCTEALPPLGQRIQYGRVDVPRETARSPGESAPAYWRWIPAASTLPDDLDPGFLNYATPSNLGADVVGFDSREPHFFQKPYLDYFGVDYDDYEQVIGMHGLDTTYVLAGAFDAATVDETLTGSGYIESGSYGEYALYTREDSPRTAAVTDGAIVWAHHEQSTAIVEAVVDAGHGDAERHHTTDEAFALATDAVGSRPWVFAGGLGIDPIDDAQFVAMAYTFDAENVYYVHTTVYPPGTALTERDVKDYLTEHGRGMDAWAVDIRIEGRILTVEMGIPPENRPKQYDGVTVPQITWGVDHAGDELTVRHEAGDTTRAESITLHAHGSDGGRSALDTQFADSSDTVEPGDSITVSVPSETTEVTGEFSPLDVARAAQFPLYTLP